MGNLGVTARFPFFMLTDISELMKSGLSSLPLSWNFIG